ncbi:MAG: triose-phosphate isomerase [Robiginitomaculum sp.]|nr:triose-phosphate isomerase [Robiginitomaculum sp.]
MKTLIAANWKMNGDLSWAQKPEVFRQVFKVEQESVDILICPPAYLIPSLVAASKSLDISIGAQDCHFATGGAFTGEMSASMMADAGAKYVIVGHSERRALFGESDEVVAKKAAAVNDTGMIPIICVGENRGQREAGQADEIVGAQLIGSLPENTYPATLIIAYEPVWAIGTGLIPTLEDIASMHDHIRGILGTLFGENKASTVPILYGGSVKPSNAKEILALSDVNGALIGGASLDMDSLAAIAKCAP